jgi:hypothetical protein
VGAVILVYVAGRFTAADRAGVERNIKAAEDVAIEVARAGHMPVCPHSNTSRPEFEDVQGYEFWIAGTMALMERCDALVTVPGWEASKGARGEASRMLQLGRPVAHSVEELLSMLPRDGAP